MTLPVVTEQMIHQYSTASSFERGEQYYAQGAVSHPTRCDMTLDARVAGSYYNTYRVAIVFDVGGISSAYCTCPYDWGGYCKHIVAVLLMQSRQPEAVIQNTPLTPTLQTLSVEQMRRLIALLLEQKPELTDWFNVMLSSITSETPGRSDTKDKQHTPIDVDTAAFRRQIKKATDRIDYHNHWDSIWDVVGALETAHAQTTTFLKRGDYGNALKLMQILGEEVIPDYESLEEECQLSDFLYSWSADLAEVILGARLPREERETLSETLARWEQEAWKYGLDELIDKPMAACVRGWDEFSPGTIDEFVDLTEAQLNVLSYEDDTEAYLALCLQRREHSRYARQLIDLGRLEEGAEHALNNPISAPDMLTLAQVMHEKDQVEAAYQLGMKGLSAEGSKHALGPWVAELAENRGQTVEAQQAWQTMFDEHPSLNAYQNLKRLSGEKWETLSSHLIAQLKAASQQSVLIEVLIEDQEIEQAIQVWGQFSYGDYNLLEKLVDAAAATRPDWAIKQALKEARGLINKKSKYYHHAVRWLGKVKTVYLQHGRSNDWEACLAAIRTEHGRKYSLMGQIEQQL